MKEERCRDCISYKVCENGQLYETPCVNFKNEADYVKVGVVDYSIKADKDKPKLRLVPTEIIRDIARVREYGVNKYGDNECWKEVEVDRYIDAAYRHLLSFVENHTGKDEESGLPHLWHLACNVAFLCELLKF